LEQLKEVNINQRNKMPQTERPQTIESKKQEGIAKAPMKKIEEPKKMTQQQEKEAEKIEKKHEEKEQSDEKQGDEKAKTEDKKHEEKKKPVVKKVKKNEVAVKGSNLHISTKYASAICKFVKRKDIDKAIADLEEVLKKKKAVPIKGGYAHKKGLGKIASGSGKYPKQATEQFIKLLKSLKGNANNHELEGPVIAEAIANIGSRPLGKFGRWKRKRTHVTIVARNKKEARKNKNEEEKNGRKKHS